MLVIIRAGKLNEKRDNIPHIPKKRRSSIAETQMSILKWNLIRVKWKSCLEKLLLSPTPFTYISLSLCFPAICLSNEILLLINAHCFH